MMGWEGIFGLILTFILLIPAQVFACPFEESQCVNGHTDSMVQAIDQLSAKPTILIYGLCFMISASFFNGFGATATKLTSASVRTLTEQMRVFFVWAFFLLSSGTAHEKFSWG